VKRLLATAFAIAFGLIVLLGYFIPLPIFAYLRQEIILWAIILAAFGVLVGVANLLAVHLEKIRRRQRGYIYSLLLVLSLVITAAFGFLLGPQNPGLRQAVEAVIVPVEASLMAILTVTLLYACIRLFRRRLDIMTVVFLVTAWLILLGTAPLPFAEIGVLNYLLRPWLIHVPAVAGARGLLIGIALGTLLTGLRILLGADRPYGGK
jgi:hypothetical protein